MSDFGFGASSASGSGGTGRTGVSSPRPEKTVLIAALLSKCVASGSSTSSSGALVFAAAAGFSDFGALSAFLSFFASFCSAFVGLDLWGRCWRGRRCWGGDYRLVGRHVRLRTRSQ
jgi:hypothetical protein